MVVKFANSDNSKYIISCEDGSEFEVFLSSEYARKTAESISKQDLVLSFYDSASGLLKVAVRAKDIKYFYKVED